MLLQGVRARRTLPRIPEADGPASGECGAGRDVRRLLVIGESTAAGVGARDHSRGLAGRVAEALAEALGSRVAWVALGRSGLTAAGVRRELLPRVDPGPVDAIVLALGANDAVGLTPVAHWQREITALCGELHARVGPAPIVVGRAPPFECSPTLPDPLRAFLGFRCQRINDATAALLPALARLRLSGQPADLAAMDFAPDGFHPNEASYARWGRHIALELAEAMHHAAS